MGIWIESKGVITLHHVMSNDRYQIEYRNTSTWQQYELIFKTMITSGELSYYSKIKTRFHFLTSKTVNATKYVK